MKELCTYNQIILHLHLEIFSQLLTYVEKCLPSAIALNDFQASWELNFTPQQTQGIGELLKMIIQLSEQFLFLSHLKF